MRSEIYDKIESAQRKLDEPLSPEDLAGGWTPNNQQWWLGYLGGLADGIAVLDDQHESNAPYQLARWLDYFGVTSGPAHDAIISVQAGLHDDRDQR